MPEKKEDVLQAVKSFSDKKAVFFDMDGLIFDTERVFMEQEAVVLKELGYHLTREIYCGTLGLSGRLLREYLEGCFGEGYPFRLVTDRVRERVRTVAETVGIGVKPGIRESLSWLAEKRMPCGVVSSSSVGTVEFYLRQAGLRKYFCDIVGGDLVQCSKPDPECYLLACRRFGTEPKECVVLEDSENGVRAAHAAGCAVICVPDLKLPCREVLAQADAVVSASL